LENLTGGKIVLNKKYKNGKAYIRVKGAILNPETVRQIPLDLECQIDTGFDGGILVPDSYKLDAKSISVEPRVTSITLADGSKTPAYVCVAHIQGIDTHSLPLPGKPVMLVMCGNRKSELLGMDALKYCTVFFDGPGQAFIMNV
jgi:predicted aspartyl protease